MGGGGGQGIQCGRFFAIDVVPVQLTIYSLSSTSASAEIFV